MFTLYRDEDGTWNARCDETHANTYGRTIEQVKGRAKEALEVAIDRDVVPDEIEFEIKLPAAVRKAIDAAQSAASDAEKANERARQAQHKAAKAMEAAGLSLRDIGTLLGFSRQRAQVVLRG